MFGSKKRLFRRMVGYVDAIKMVVYTKLRPELEKQYDEEQAKLLSGAVVNRLFGSAASPMHANIPATLIDELATDFLWNEEDKDILHGIVMSLRTKAILKTAETDAPNMEAIDRISDTVQWVKTIIPLPPEAPDPKTMERLAVMLQSRYFEQGRTKINAEQWSDYAIKQITSKEWDKVRKEFYNRSKEQISEIISIPEHIFTAEMLGAQLALLSFICTKTNLKVAYTIYPAIFKYFKNVPNSVKEYVEGGYTHANRKVAAFGKRGISADIAIATECAERLKLNTPSEFIEQLAEQFEALGRIWITDISQYRFT